MQQNKWDKQFLSVLRLEYDTAVRYLAASWQSNLAATNSFWNL